MFTILVESMITGALAGFAFSVGASRMFHAPGVQAMGAFRTLGEMNACKGDALSHLGFGASFIAPIAISVVASGGTGPDIWHRIVPNLTAGILLLRNKDPEKTIRNPYAMGSVGAVVGALMMMFLMSLASAIPADMAVIAQKVMVPAGQAMMDYVMPLIFFLAAIDAGVHTGVAAIIYGGAAQMVMGSAVPGCVMGILIGKAVEIDGWKKSTYAMVGLVTTVFFAIAYFRGFFTTLAKLFGI